MSEEVRPSERNLNKIPNLGDLFFKPTDRRVCVQIRARDDLLYLSLERCVSGLVVR